MEPKPNAHADTAAGPQLLLHAWPTADGWSAQVAAVEAAQPRPLDTGFLPGLLATGATEAAALTILQEKIDAAYTQEGSARGR
jgi:hypothetical protein